MSRTQLTKIINQQNTSKVYMDFNDVDMQKTLDPLFDNNHLSCSLHAYKN